MAFPYLQYEGFEAGTLGSFDVETDTETRLDFPHYSELARIPGLPAPYRGAYCMRVNLANDGTPADAYVQETGSLDLSADGTAFARFAFWLSPDTVSANNDEFAIFQLWSSTNTVEAGLYVNYTTANGFRLGIGETSGSVFKPLTLGVWHMIEIGVNVDAGGGNDGTVDAWLDGSAYTQVTGLDQGASTSGVLGVLAQDAGTTRGVALFDEWVVDDTRVGPIIDRFPTVVVLAGTTTGYSGHVFVGKGCVANASLESGGGTDNVLTIYDTDTAYTTDSTLAKLELKNTANSELVDPAAPPLELKRGCYVVLTGTSPRAKIKICPVHYSDGAIRNLGSRRVPHPIMG